MAAPMPLDAPVTTATLPVSLLIVLSFLRGYEEPSISEKRRSKTLSQRVSQVFAYPNTRYFPSFPVNPPHYMWRCWIFSCLLIDRKVQSIERLKALLATH